MCANILRRSGNASINPGVAKFGIALEWGSRGLEFESRHSDQKQKQQMLFLLFYFLYLKLPYFSLKAEDNANASLRSIQKNLKEKCSSRFYNKDAILK